MAQTWIVYESLFGTYAYMLQPVYQTRRSPSRMTNQPLWSFASIDAARIASRSLNEKRMASRTAAGKPFSYYDGEQIQRNGL